MKKRLNKRRNTSTTVTAIRLFNEQFDALKKLPPNVSTSVLVRTLLQEYLKGNLPNVHTLVLEEAARTTSAIRSTRF